MEKNLFEGVSFFENKKVLNLNKRERIQDYIRSRYILSTIAECTLLYCCMCADSTGKTSADVLLKKLSEYTGINTLEGLKELENKGTIKCKQNSIIILI